MTIGVVRVGTRGSRLARAQTAIVQSLLSEKFPDLRMQVINVKTAGDRLPPSRRGLDDEKSAFTSDIERMLIRGDLDFAVHSMKDLPSTLGSGLVIGATPPRGDPRDALVSDDGKSISQLPRGALVGTSSLRRKMQLRSLREDIRIVDLYGNIETRIRKMREMGLNAIVLATCGLQRIEMTGVHVRPFSIEEMLPAACQGILAIEVRRDDKQVLKLVSQINDQRTSQQAACERAFIERLGADCDVPVAAYSYEECGNLVAVGMLASPDGIKVLRSKLIDKPSSASSLGYRLAEELLSMGGEKILTGHVA
jgi:hydroxymethylbilane synthase